MKFGCTKVEYVMPIWLRRKDYHEKNSHYLTKCRKTQSYQLQ